MPERKRQLFLTGSIPKALLTLAIPVILGNVLQAGYQLTDAFWVGRLGENAVASVAVSMPVAFLVIAMGSGLAMAGATLTSQYIGAGNQAMVNHVAAQTLLMVVFTSLVLGGLGFLLAPSLLTLLGVAPEVHDGALGFMRVSFIGVVFVFTYNMFQSLMRGVGETRIPLLIVLGTVILNMGLDPLFIFGWGPIPGHGVMGAAMATLTTQGLAALIGIAVLLRGKHGIQLNLSAFKPDFTHIKKSLFLGLPGSVELSTRAMGVIMMSFLVASFGTLSMAAFGVGSNILQFITIPALGLSMSVSTLVGQNMGAGNLDRAARITRLSMLLGFSTLTLVGATVYLAAPYIVAFFVPQEADVIEEGARFIRTMCLAWGGISVQMCVVATFRASGHMMNAMVIALVSQWMIQFPLAYILSKHTELGVSGLWWSYPVTNFMVALISLAWFARGTWKTNRITPDEKQTIEVTDNALSEDGYRHGM